MPSRPLPSAFYWLVLTIVLDPLAVAPTPNTKHLSIVLKPRDWMEPREYANFTCGIDTSADPNRLVAEQNSLFIFEHFLDKNSERNSDYRTKVFDVVTIKNDGTREVMTDNQLCHSDLEVPGLYSLFLSPSKAQCNWRTFEEAVEARGVGYYPVYIGISGNFSEIIKKFSNSADTFKEFFKEATPKLCGTKLKMRSETASSRKDTLTDLFNFIYNSETERSFNPAEEKSCWSSTETIDAIIKSNFFELNPLARFEKNDYNVSELDGFARAKIVRTATDRKAMVVMETEFPTRGGIPAGPEDIVEMNAPVIFKVGSNETEVLVRIKADNKREETEIFRVVIQGLNDMKKNNRVKRMVKQSANFNLLNSDSESNSDSEEKGEEVEEVLDPETRIRESFTALTAHAATAELWIGHAEEAWTDCDAKHGNAGKPPRDTVPELGEAKTKLKKIRKLKVKAGDMRTDLPLTEIKAIEAEKWAAEAKVAAEEAANKATIAARKINQIEPPKQKKEEEPKVIDPEYYRVTRGGLECSAPFGTWKNYDGAGKVVQRWTEDFYTKHVEGKFKGSTGKDEEKTVLNRDQLVELYLSYNPKTKTGIHTINGIRSGRKSLVASDKATPQGFWSHYGRAKA